MKIIAKQVMTITLELSDKTFATAKAAGVPTPQWKWCSRVQSVFCGALSSWRMKLSQHLWSFLLMVMQPSFHRQRQS